MVTACALGNAKQCADAKKPAEAGFFKVRRQLADVLADQASHFEHRNLWLAKHFLELGVSIDHALVGCILQVVGLDVDSQLADDFCTWKGSGTDHSSQSSARGQGFHEGGVRSTFFCGGRWSSGCLLCSCHFVSLNEDGFI